MRTKNLLWFLLVFGVCFLLLTSFISIQDGKEKVLKLTIPAGWPKLVYDFDKSPLTQKGFELGRMLFYDPILSGDSTISCASCHLQQTNFTHIDHSLSHGIEGKVGTRNSLTIVNIAWSKNFMWDGGINHIEVQPLGPLESPVEMRSSLKEVLPKLQRSSFYQRKFKEAFGSKTEISGQQVLKALSQYMLMLQSFNSKYDKVMRKDPGIVFTESESRGLEVFRKSCETCHREPLFTNNEFANNGLEPDDFLKDGGRIKITGQLSDSLKFKVPTLRNIEVSYPYMHDGRYRNLQMVLFHYSNNISKTINLAPELAQPLDLNEQNKNDLIAFMKTLTDTTFLNKPEFGYPMGAFGSMGVR